MSKTSITVSIDLLDAFEKEIYDYVMSQGKRKKSGFIKRVLYLHKLGVSENKPIIAQVEPSEEKENMESFL